MSGFLIGVLLRSRVIRIDLKGDPNKEGYGLLSYCCISTLDIIFGRLRDFDIKSVAYADDLIALVLGIYPQMLSDIL